jgi:hypothetical protein
MSHSQNEQHEPAEGNTPRAGSGKHRGRRRSGGLTLTAGSGILALEPHFSPAELAETWGLSPDFIRDRFRDEPGVLKIDRPEKMHKRKYVTLRIPRSIAQKVHQDLAA